MPRNQPGRRSITAATIKAAFRECELGMTADRSDAETPGLQLRIRPSGVRWSVRGRLSGREIRYDLGPAIEVDIDEARLRARRVREMMRQGQDPASHIQSMLTGEPVQPKSAKDKKAAAERWTFRETRDAFLLWMRPTRRDATIADYRKKLHMKEFDEYLDRHIATISRAEIAATIETISKRGIPSAEGALRTIKSMWNWASEPVREEKTGLSVDLLRRVKAPERPSIEAGSPEAAKKVQVQKLPTPEQLGTLVAIARTGVLEGRISAAITLLMYTAQRRRAVVSATATDFFLTDGGWQWSMKPYFRKTARKRKSQADHVVPLVPEVSGTLEELIDYATRPKAPSRHIFPQFRRRSAKEAGRFSHMNESTLTHALASLPGVDCSPHDIRRAFSTYIKQLGYLGKSSKLILDHMEGSDGDDVDAQSYDYNLLLDEKKAMMRDWAAFLEKACQAAIAANPLLSDPEALREAIDRKRYKVDTVLDLTDLTRPNPNAADQRPAA
jgi:hypothetical protein